MESLPLARAAFAEGRLSYSKLRALVKIVTSETEAQLVEWAQCSTAAQFEKVVAGRRSVDRKARDDRYVSWITDDDGSLVLRARLSPEEGALLIAALRSARDALSTGADPKSVSAETLLRPSNADALVAMAETTLAHGPTPVAGGDRHMVLVHVNAETNEATLDSGHVLDAETAGMIRCDAAEATIVLGEEGEPLAMGRKTREPTVAQRRSLNVRDGQCMFPACTQALFVDAHHVRYWENGGPTAVDNLVLLCRVHHRAIHHRNYRIESGPHQTFRFFRGDGLELIAAPPPRNREPQCNQAARYTTRSRLTLRCQSGTATTPTTQPRSKGCCGWKNTGNMSASLSVAEPSDGEFAVTSGHGAHATCSRARRRSRQAASD